MTRGKQIIDVRPKQGTMQSLGQCRPVVRSVTRCLVARFRWLCDPSVRARVRLVHEFTRQSQTVPLAINLQRQNGNRETENEGRESESAALGGVNATCFRCVSARIVSSSNENATGRLWMV